MMGDTVHLKDTDIEISVKSPGDALLKLIRNGNILKETYHHELKSKVTEPGVYRIEAYLKGRPWVYTNPIYVR